MKATGKPSVEHLLIIEPLCQTPRLEPNLPSGTSQSEPDHPPKPMLPLMCTLAFQNPIPLLLKPAFSQAAETAPTARPSMPPPLRLDQPELRPKYPDLPLFMQPKGQIQETKSEYLSVEMQSQVDDLPIMEIEAKKSDSKKVGSISIMEPVSYGESGEAAKSLNMLAQVLDNETNSKGRTSPRSPHRKPKRVLKSPPQLTRKKLRKKTRSCSLWRNSAGCGGPTPTSSCRASGRPTSAQHRHPADLVLRGFERLLQAHPVTAQRKQRRRDPVRRHAGAAEDKRNAV